MKGRVRNYQGRTRGIYLGDDIVERTKNNGRELGVKLNRDLSFSEIVTEALAQWNDNAERVTKKKAAKHGS